MPKEEQITKAIKNLIDSWDMDTLVNFAYDERFYYFMDKASEEEDIVESSQPEMVTKSQHEFSTETPRPGSALETVDKSFSKDYSPILKDAREQGYEGLSVVAQNILSGKYYKPTPEEVGL